MVNVSDIAGKKVISLNGDSVGEVKDVEFDLNDWKIKSVQMKLSDKAATELGYQKRIGSYTVCMPVDFISSVSDVITINKSLLEITKDKLIVRCVG